MAIVSCGFGESGIGKTASIGQAAKYYYEKFGKPSRLITAEGFQTIQKLIDIGIVEVLSIPNITQPLALLRALANGQYPESVSPSGELLSTTLLPRNKSGVENYSCYFIEGVTTLAEMLLEEQSGQTLAMKPSWSQTVKSVYGTEEKYGGVSQDAYNFVQKEIIRLITLFRGLSVHRVHFTAHENKGMDETTGRMIRGIGIVGQKGTDRIPKRFDEVLHHDIITTQKKVGAITEQHEERRIYFTPHQDSEVSGLLYKGIKARVSPEMVPELMKTFPGGYVVATPGKDGKGLDEFFRVEDELNKADNDDDLQQWKAKIDQKFKQSNSK